MDWSKAKNILIIAFLITNIILIYNIIDKYGNKETDISQENINETIELLEQNNIYVNPDDIDKEKRNMPVLKVQYDDNKKYRIDDAINNQEIYVENLNEDIAKQIAEEFLKDIDIMNENVVYDRTIKSEDGYVVIYSNKYDDMYIEDSYIKCKVNNNGVYDVSRVWLEPVEYGKTTKAIIPSTSALLKFMSNTSYEEKIIVKDIRLVYWLDTALIDLENINIDTAFPAWRIQYNDNQEKFIIAYRN